MICIKCKKNKHSTSFHWKISRVKRRPDCKLCVKAKAKIRYKKFKKVLCLQSMKNRAQRRLLCRKISLEEKNKPCADCKINYPHYVMDFDHVREVKLAHVSHLVSRGCAEKTLRDEMSKCEVVCSNCHRTRTHLRKEAKQRSSHCSTSP